MPVVGSVKNMPSRSTSETRNACRRSGSGSSSSRFESDGAICSRLRPPRAAGQDAAPSGFAGSALARCRRRRGRAGEIGVGVVSCGNGSRSWVAFHVRVDLRQCDWQIAASPAGTRPGMDGLTLFGLFAVTAMLVCYALEDRTSPVCPGLRRRLRAGLDLRLPAGRVAVRAGRGDLGRRRVAAMDAQEPGERIARCAGAVLGCCRPRQRRHLTLKHLHSSMTERADHVAGSQTYRAFQDRISDRAGADGRRHGCRSGDRRGAGRRAGIAALRHAAGGEGPRAGQHHPPARLGAGQHELLLPHRRRCGSAARGRLEAAAGVLLQRTRSRSDGADQCRQPRAVRCRDVRAGRGVEAGSGQLPFRPAGAGAARAGQGGGLSS